MKKTDPNIAQSSFSLQRGKEAGLCTHAYNNSAQHNRVLEGLDEKESHVSIKGFDGEERSRICPRCKIIYTPQTKNKKIKRH